MLFDPKVYRKKQMSQLGGGEVPRTIQRFEQAKTLNDYTKCFLYSAIKAIYFEHHPDKDKIKPISSEK
jgi:hypothetical protein